MESRTVGRLDVCVRASQRIAKRLIVGSSCASRLPRRKAWQRRESVTESKQNQISIRERRAQQEQQRRRLLHLLRVHWACDMHLVLGSALAVASLRSAPKSRPSGSLWLSAEFSSSILCHRWLAWLGAALLCSAPLSRTRARRCVGLRSSGLWVGAESELCAHRVALARASADEAPRLRIKSSGSELDSIASLRGRRLVSRRVCEPVSSLFVSLTVS